MSEKGSSFVEHARHVEIETEEGEKKHADIDRVVEEAKKARDRAVEAAKDAEETEKRVREIHREIADQEEGGTKSEKPVETVPQIAPPSREPISALAKYGVVTGVEKMGDLVTKAQNVGSDILTSIENWGHKTMKANIPKIQWVAQRIPFVGKWVFAEPEKPRADRMKEEEKKRQELLKEQKQKSAEAKKAKDAADKKAEDAKRKAEDAEYKAEQAKKAKEAADALREKESLMTAFERYSYDNGDDAKKEEILKQVEANLESRRAQKKEHEYDQMLMKHMSPEEKKVYGAEEAGTEEERARQKEEKARLRAVVISELSNPERIERAKKAQGGKKGKGKGGGGGGRGHRRG